MYLPILCVRNCCSEYLRQQTISSRTMKHHICYQLLFSHNSIVLKKLSPPQKVYNQPSLNHHHHPSLSSPAPHRGFNFPLPDSKSRTPLLFPLSKCKDDTPLRNRLRDGHGSQRIHGLFQHNLHHHHPHPYFSGSSPLPHTQLQLDLTPYYGQWPPSLLGLPLQLYHNHNHLHTFYPRRNPHPHPHPYYLPFSY